MRLYGLLGGGGGASTYLCAKCAANFGGMGACSPGNFDFGPFIRRNLVESGTVFTPPWTVFAPPPLPQPPLKETLSTMR